MLSDGAVVSAAMEALALARGLAVDPDMFLQAVAGRFSRAAELGHADEDMAATHFASFDGS